MSFIKNVNTNFALQFYIKPSTTINLQNESSNSTTGTVSNPYLFYPMQGRGAGLPTNGVGFGVAVGTNGLMCVEHTSDYAPPILSTAVDLSGKWSWITINVVNKRATLWVNGEKIKDGLTSSRIPYLCTSFGGGDWGSYNGGLMEVSLWDRSLTDNEIKTGVKKGIDPNTQGIIHYYKFDEGKGLTVNNSAKNTSETIALIDESMWKYDNVEFTPFKLSPGSGIMYAEKNYELAQNQKFQRGAGYKGVDDKGNKKKIINTNIFEGVDIGNIASVFNTENTTLSFGEYKEVDIFSIIQQFSSMEKSVNEGVMNQLIRIFPPSKAFKSGSFENYAFIIRNLNWSTSTMLSFSNSAIQKFTFKRGENVICNDDFLIGDIRGYQLVEKNKLTQIVYDGELEVRPKQKKVDTAVVCLIDRGMVFGVFNGRFQPEYEFNGGYDHDNEGLVDPHAEFIDLMESYEPFEFSDSITIEESVDNVTKLLQDKFIEWTPMRVFDNVIVTQEKMGESFMFNSVNKDLYNYNGRLVEFKDDGVKVQESYREESIKQQKDLYSTYEFNFDIVDFRLIDSFVYEE